MGHPIRPEHASGTTAEPSSSGSDGGLSHSALTAIIVVIVVIVVAVVVAGYLYVKRYVSVTIVGGELVCRCSVAFSV